MKTLTKQDCENIILKLAGPEGEIACYCDCAFCQGCEHDIYQKDVLIGPVLEKMKLRLPERYHDQFPGAGASLVDLVFAWNKCGLEKSLQSILAEAVWETSIKTDRPLHKGGGYPVQIPKQPAIRELFEFLSNLVYETP